MVGIILATHGNFATGILQSASMIFGEQPNVAAVTLQPNEGPDDVRRKMEEAVASFEDPEQVLILVDLWGGTPFNQSNGLIAGHEDKWAIVAGLNLPMLIDAYASRMMMETAHELAVQIPAAPKKAFVFIRNLWSRRKQNRRQQQLPTDSRQALCRREQWLATERSNTCWHVSTPVCFTDRWQLPGQRPQIQTESLLYPMVWLTTICVRA